MTTAAWPELTSTFAGHQLSAPPIPASMRHGLRTVADWCWSTRPIDPMAMYRFTAPHELLLFPRPEGEFAAVGHAGEGLNSYAISSFLVHRELALFAQAPWGGVNSDPARAAELVNALFSGCAELLECAAARTPAELPWRLVCLVSAVHGTASAGWVRLPPAGATAVEGLAGVPAMQPDEVLPAAVAMLRAGPPAL